MRVGVEGVAQTELHQVLSASALAHAGSGEAPSAPAGAGRLRIAAKAAFSSAVFQGRSSGLLEHVCRVPRAAGNRGRGDHRSVDGHLARLRPQQTGQRVQQGGLATSARPHESHPVARVERQVDALHHRPRRVAKSEAGRGEPDSRHPTSPARGSRW